MASKKKKYNREVFIDHALINLYIFLFVAIAGVFVKTSLIFVALLFLCVSISFAVIAGNMEDTSNEDEPCPLH